MGFMNGGRGNGMTAGGFGGANGFMNGNGRYGAQDNFRPHNYRTKPCRFFQQGMCKNGDRCTFLHVKEEGQPGGQPGGQQQRW